MNTKRFFAALTAAGMLLTGAAFANEEEIMLISEPAASEPAAHINGGCIPSVEAITIDDITMIPLRFVGENLGYTVNWNGENQSIDLIQGASFITMQIGTDGYAFSRQAHRPLGAAPTLVDDCTTYVPINFVTEMLGGVYNEVEANVYEIVTPSFVTVKEIQEDGSLLVEDEVRGEVLVLIADTTVIRAGEETATADAIKVGDALNVGYGATMTMSIPPQTTAKFIRLTDVVVEEIEVEGVAFSGIITEITDEMIVLGNPAEDADAIALILSEETEIEGELKVGDKVEGLRSERATFSIPPQSVALTIQVVK